MHLLSEKMTKLDAPSICDARTLLFSQRREFNHKIKGIGHSSFLPEDTAKLRRPDAGNEAVNARYLARFDPRRERIRAPTGSDDLVKLRAWMQKKYVDRSWMEPDSGGQSTERRGTAKKPSGGGGASGGGTSGGGASSGRKNSSKSGGRKAGKQHSKSPTPQQPPQPQPDLFGFDSAPSASPAAAPPVNDAWMPLADHPNIRTPLS